MLWQDILLKISNAYVVPTRDSNAFPCICTTGKEGTHTTWQSSNCQLFKNNCSDITWERRTSPFYLSPSPKSPIKSSWECCKGSGNISLEIKIEDCTGEEPESLGKAQACSSSGFTNCQGFKRKTNSPPRRMPSCNTSLLSDLEDYTETWRQPPKSPDDGMEQFCSVTPWEPGSQS